MNQFIITQKLEVSTVLPSNSAYLSIHLRTGIQWTIVSIGICVSSQYEVRIDYFDAIQIGDNSGEQNQWLESSSPREASQTTLSYRAVWTLSCYARLPQHPWSPSTAQIQPETRQSFPIYQHCLCLRIHLFFFLRSPHYDIELVMFRNRIT